MAGVFRVQQNMAAPVAGQCYIDSCHACCPGYIKLN